MSATQDSVQTAATPTVMQANTFNLSGHGLHVAYASTSFTGQPRMTYQDSAQTRSFSGTEIRRVEVADLGTIVSVTLSIVPDVGSTTFSVVIPTVFVASTGTPAAVTTDAVTTLHRMPFVARFIGQREIYQGACLTGTAEALVF